MSVSSYCCCHTCCFQAPVPSPHPPQAMIRWPGDRSELSLAATTLSSAHQPISQQSSPLNRPVHHVERQQEISRCQISFIFDILAASVYFPNFYDSKTDVIAMIINYCRKSVDFSSTLKIFGNFNSQVGLMRTGLQATSNTERNKSCRNQHILED